MCAARDGGIHSARRPQRARKLLLPATGESIMDTPRFEPLPTFGILDQAFRLYRSRFVHLVTVVAVVQVPLALGMAAVMALAAWRCSDGGSAVGIPPGVFMAAVGLGWLFIVVISLVGQQIARRLR